MSFTIWLTGLPAIGKSTTARQVCDVLSTKGYPVELLDSDTVAGYFGTLPAWDADAGRDIIARCMAVTAMHLNRRDIICICAATSPSRTIREQHRKLIPRYIEVYCRGTIETARQRDTQGLYTLADTGFIEKFTGVDAPYEAPGNPELILDMASLSPPACVETILAYLRKHLKIASCPGNRARNV